MWYRFGRTDRLAVGRYDHDWWCLPEQGPMFHRNRLGLLVLLGGAAAVCMRP
jgi:hypothetical protein